MVGREHQPSDSCPSTSKRCVKQDSAHPEFIQHLPWTCFILSLCWLLGLLRMKEMELLSLNSSQSRVKDRQLGKKFIKELLV